ncbi:hypothetical protein F0562_009414 [Nyssa sinensis]|uniref:Uncharacterized protein n=1 Tax=Nyssa sinensis TaxID=561372 RepID=A0A5J5A0V7_9ASTE|nr:hypothetical protein F0562_009414 [Nyssa sinensis]
MQPCDLGPPNVLIGWHFKDGRGDAEALIGSDPSLYNASMVNSSCYFRYKSLGKDHHHYSLSFMARF